MIDFEDYLDVEVFDEQRHLFGTLSCFWTDDDHETQLLGIELKTRPDGTCAVPLDLCTADERQSCITISALTQHIAAAPFLDCDAELDSAFAEKVYVHFGLTPPASPHRLAINRDRSKARPGQNR